MRRIVARSWPIWVIGLGFYLPVAITFFNDARMGSWAEAFSSTWAAIPLFFSTALLALASAFLATFIGAVDALLYSAFRQPRGAWLWLLPCLLLTFTTPPAAIASAIQSAFGSTMLIGGFRDEFGTVLLLTLRWAPVAFLVLAGLTITIPHSQELALRQLPPKTALRLRWQLQAPWRRACFFLLFLLMLPAAEIPSYTGVETISRRIMARLTIGDGLSGWLLALGLALLLVPIIVYWFPSQRLLGRSFQVRDPHGLPRSNWLLPWWLLRLIPVVALISVLWVTALPQASETEAASREFLGALWDGLSELPRGIIVVVLPTLACWSLVSQQRTRALLLWCMPTFLPVSLIALALASSVRPWLPAALDSFPLLLSIAQMIQLGALAVIVGILSLRMIPKHELQSAQLLPPGWSRWKVLFPRSLPVLLPAAILGMLLILGEVQSTLILAPPGHPSPALELHQLLHFRNDEQAARLALALVVISLLWTLLFSWLIRGKGDSDGK
ncbi:MAG: hypothetical protein CBC13_11410 [Planctomycetia bacterium TMED53]|nr:MAG: hypothetical protein CBC13_11410 [Planctomycetia bacterium TMED53]